MSKDGTNVLQFTRKKQLPPLDLEPTSSDEAFEIEHLQYTAARMANLRERHLCMHIDLLMRAENPDAMLDSIEADMIRDVKSVMDYCRRRIQSRLPKEVVFRELMLARMSPDVRETLDDIRSDQLHLDYAEGILEENAQNKS